MGESRVLTLGEKAAREEGREKNRGGGVRAEESSQEAGAGEGRFEGAGKGIGACEAQEHEDWQFTFKRLPLRRLQVCDSQPHCKDESYCTPMHLPPLPVEEGDGR